MTGVRLAIDYGTSNTVAVVDLGDGRVRPLLIDGSPLLSSAVYAQSDGDVLTGRDAENSARLDPSRYEPNPKRRIDDREVLLGDRSWPLAELMGQTLRHVAHEAARTTGAPITDLIMTCPVAWGPLRRRTLLAAAELAGLPKPVLLTEPVAAAAYLAARTQGQVAADRSVVVYDLGGGTFDVCVLRRDGEGFQPLAYRGMDDFGGVDLDALVVSQIAEAVKPTDPQAWQRLTSPQSQADQRHARAMWDDARAAKERLSRRPSAQLLVPLADRDALVSRETFERAARIPLTRTIDITLAVMREAQVDPSNVAGIFLVGGSTRVPLVATMLHQRLGTAPTIIEQPETVVAEGALVAVSAPQRHPATIPATQAVAVLPGSPTARRANAPVPAPVHASQSSPPPAAQTKSRLPILPLVGAVLAAVALLALIIAPWTALGSGNEEPVIIGGVYGSLLLALSAPAVWSWHRFPKPARFALPAVYLALSGYWAVADAANEDLHRASVAEGGAISLIVISAATLVLTAATYVIGRRTPRAPTTLERPSQ